MKKIFTIERSNLKSGNYQERTTQVIGQQPRQREVDHLSDVLKLLAGNPPKGGC